MAAGDLHIFDQFLEDVGLALHQLETETFKCALITSATTPAEDTATPTWGGAGTDMSANEVSGTNYTAGGTDIAATYSETTGTATFDGATNPSWTQHATNPAEARWAIIYNTQAAKECVAYVDLGANIDMRNGDLSITWATSTGIFQATSTAGV